ncbi:MAG: HD domain-containing protein, partial [Acutalibacteraceae bacterium]
DYDIINAVRYHTTGRAGATMLEKIIYLADFISDERDFDGVEKIRKSVDGGLDNAMYTATRFTIEDLAAAGRPIHPDSVAAYNEVVIKKASD